MKKFITLILGLLVAGAALAVIPKKFKEKKATTEYQSLITHEVSADIKLVDHDVKGVNESVIEIGSSYWQDIENPIKESKNLALKEKLSELHMVSDDMRKPRKGFNRIDVPLNTRNC